MILISILLSIIISNEVTNDSLSVLITEKTSQILDEVTYIDPLKGKRFGIEISPLYTMLYDDGPSVSGSFSRFDLSETAEITFPFSYHTYSDREYNPTTGFVDVNKVYWYVDGQYRFFLGEHRTGRWIGAGARVFRGEDSEGSYTKGGISFGIGTRRFSQKGWYWGASIYLGKYYFGETDKGPDINWFFKWELLKFGFAF